MSTEVTKSAEEQLADVVKSAVESKADVSAVDAVKAAVDAIEVPSVEGFVKAEVVEALTAALAAEKTAREDLEAVVKAAPAIITKETPAMSSLITFKGADFDLSGRGNSIVAKSTIDFSEEFAKAELGTGSTGVVDGSTVASQRLYYQMQQKNPFRSVSTVMPTSGGSVNLPSVTSITAGVENTLRAGALTDGGGIDTIPVIPQNWVSRNIFSDQHAEDLPGLDQMVAGFMAQAIARAEAADMVSRLGAATLGEVNTGAASALPDGIDEWADLMMSLDSAYRDGSQWMMSRAAYAHLRSTTQGGTGSDLLFDAGLGKMSFMGYGIIINDHLDDGDTAGDNAVYFGDFKAGTIIVSRKEMSISRHEDTFPGGLYYYGNMRSRGVAWDTDALVRFNTAV